MGEPDSLGRRNVGAAVIYHATAPIADYLVDDADAIVLVGETLMRGSIVSLAILEYCEQPRSKQEIAAHCRSLFGDPPGTTVEAFVGDALDQLCTAKVLEQVSQLDASRDR